MSGAEGLVERLDGAARYAYVPHAVRQLMIDTKDALASLTAENDRLTALVHTQAEEAAKAAREYADNMERLRAELAAAWGALEDIRDCDTKEVTTLRALARAHLANRSDDDA